MDEHGNMVGLSLPDGNQLSFTYDEFARLLEERDPLGRKTTYEYHHLTRLVTKVTYPDGSTWQARYDDKQDLPFNKAVSAMRGELQKIGVEVFGTI